MLEWTDRAREKAEMASQAVKRGVPEERLAGARRRGRELDEEARLRHSREEAAEALDAAVEGADPDALRAVLEGATKLGAASEEAVQRASQRPALPEEARSQYRAIKKAAVDLEAAELSPVRRPYKSTPFRSSAPAQGRPPSPRGAARRPCPAPRPPPPPGAAAWAAVAAGSTRRAGRGGRNGSVL